MTRKRFRITPELPKGWVDIIDTDDNRTLCNIRIEYANNMIKLLNDLADENEQLLHDATILIQSNQDYRKENEQLLQFKYKVYRVINERIELLESDYNKAVKAGMPSNSVYGEIELLEDLRKELEE